MAQFDVYRNLSKTTQKKFPYLLDIQNDLHSRLYTRLVIPLAAGAEPIRHMMPVFEIENKTVVMYTMEMTSVMRDILNIKVTNIEEYRSEIINALDFLINGF